MGILDLLKPKKEFLPDGRPLVLDKRVKIFRQDDYQMSFLEALELQNLLVERDDDNNNVLFLSPKELKHQATFYVELKRSTLEHIVNIINSTKNIDTYFNSVNKLREISEELAQFEKLRIFSPGYSPTEQWNNFLEHLHETEDGFVKRHYSAFIQKLEKYKTEKSKQKALLQYFALWKTCYDSLLPETVEFIEWLRKEWKIELPDNGNQ